MIVDLAARHPLEREVAHRAGEQPVILPRGSGDVGVRESPLVREELDHRDLALTVLLELGDVRGHGVGEAEGAPLNEEPDRAGGQDLGVGVEQPERVVVGGRPRRVDHAVAERLDDGELTVARDRDLGAGIASGGDVLVDDVEETVERIGREADVTERGGR